MEFDKDLQARQEARHLCRRAQQAQMELEAMTQAQRDSICRAMSQSFARKAELLGKLAAEETGFGNAADKAVKNHFASQRVWETIEAMEPLAIRKGEGEDWEMGVPVGVIAAIVPSTNPTSTVCYKALIALKSGNTIVFSPHPKALQCTLAAAKLLSQAAVAAGAPEGCIDCLSLGAMAGTQELMAAPEIRLILATGGPAMVKAAYSSGKPAIGVGAGNGPAYIHASADVKQALSHILRSKTFDFGTVCASEQSIIVEKDMEQAVISEGTALGFYFMSREEAAKLEALLFRGNGALNPQVVGKSAQALAKLAGFCIPEKAQVLVARATEAGKGYALEKLCPVLGFFVEETESAVLKKSQAILHYEGVGHTFSIHATDKAVVERFARAMPVSRFLVNTPAALGGIGESTRLFPALTLGCGAVGGSSSSNNISPMDLVNIRRIAWGKAQSPKPDVNLDALAQKILERLKR